MLTAVKHVADDKIVLCSAGQHTGTPCMQHSQTAGERTLNFTSFYNDLQLNSPAVKPTDYKI